MSTTPILEVRNLVVAFATSTGGVEAVRGVDLAVLPGEVSLLKA